MVAPQFTIKVTFGGEKTSSYYNIATGIPTSGLPNSMDYVYGSPTLLSYLRASETHFVIYHP